MAKKHSLLFVDNSKLYYQTREQIASGKFITPDGDYFPLARLRGEHGKVIIQPDPDKLDLYMLSDNEIDTWKKTMLDYVNQLSDLTADVFDIITIEWLKRAKSPTDFVELDVDDILRYRGLLANPNSDNRRGGYKSTQREAIAQQIRLLSHVWVQAEKEVQQSQHTKKDTLRGRAVYLGMEYQRQDQEGNTEIFIVRARPGDMFAQALFKRGLRQVALLSQKALAYDPNKFPYEKRLTRYLAYIWRNRQQQASYLDAISVNVLLNAAALEPQHDRPTRTRERFEKTLDRLAADSVISHWLYSNVEETQLAGKGWLKKWMQWKVSIEPPADITEHYTTQIKNPQKKIPSKLSNTSEQLRAIRKEKKLSLSQVAEEMGINLSTLSRIENNKTTPRGSTKKKIDAWLEEME